VIDAATKPIAIGIPWYTRRTYHEILELMEDAETFPKNFDDWRAKAQATEEKVESEGTAVVRALIDPDDFFLWCKSHGLRLNGVARGKFASEVAFAAVKRAH
jgi:hypothetical protein